MRKGIQEEQERLDRAWDREWDRAHGHDVSDSDNEELIDNAQLRVDCDAVNIKKSGSSKADLINSDFGREGLSANSKRARLSIAAAKAGN